MTHIGCGRRWAVSLLLLLCASLGGCQTARNLALYAPASWTGLDELGADLRVERTASLKQRAQALRLRDEARARLAAVMGSVQARPVHVFCFTDTCYQSFGGGRPKAKSFGDHYTLIGPAGLTTGFVAHEWWHAELFYRLGLSSRLKVPTWFDEGAAVWVSADEARYGEAMYQRVLAQGITPPTLDEIATLDSFNAAVGRYGDHLWANKPPDAVTVVYPTAAREVRRWMRIVGINGLRELVGRLEHKEPFEAVYADLEQRGAPR